MSIDVPFSESLPSFATYKTLGAELIPVADALIETFSPRIISELVMVTIPEVMVLFEPSIVTDPLPIVRIPVTLASPSTITVVVPVPI